MIQVFSRHTDELLFEIPLPQLALGILQHIFGISSSNPMFDSYRITPEIAEDLRRFVKIPGELDFAQMDCFLCCHADE